MSNEEKRKLAIDILELFEDLLEDKKIEIPCEDPSEEKARHFDANDTKLYGMEYWTLADKIESLL